jgi:hypothetical protein
MLRTAIRAVTADLQTPDADKGPHGDSYPPMSGAGFLGFTKKSAGTCFNDVPLVIAGDATENLK